MEQDIRTERYAGHTGGKWLLKWMAEDGDMILHVKNDRIVCPLATIHIGMTEEDARGREIPDPDCADSINARLMQDAPALLRDRDRWRGVADGLAVLVRQGRELAIDRDAGIERFDAALAAYDAACKGQPT
jgi:hypothetical protein